MYSILENYLPADICTNRHCSVVSPFTKMKVPTKLVYDLVNVQHSYTSACRLTTAPVTSQHGPLYQRSDPVPSKIMVKSPNPPHQPSSMNKFSLFFSPLLSVPCMVISLLSFLHAHSRYFPYTTCVFYLEFVFDHLMLSHTPLMLLVVVIPRIVPSFHFLSIPEDQFSSKHYSFANF
jgi:hypothetical protein